MQNKFDTWAKWFAIPIGFTLPISTAADNILLYLALTALLLGGRYRHKLRIITSNPVAMAALLLVCALMLGGLYGHAAWSDVQHYLRKYAPLLSIAFLIPLFQDKPSREYALTGFLLAMGLTLLLSCVIATGWFADRAWFQGTVDNAFVFKLHITQNIFMAFFAYALALKARSTVRLDLRLVYGFAALLAAYNVLFMVQGRSGYVVLAVLWLYFCFRWLRWKGLAVAGLVGFGVATMGYFVSTNLHERVNLVIQETAAWKPGHAATSSSGLRMDYYTNSLKIIRDHPFLGVGTGGFALAYTEKIKGTKSAPSNNPHNQYLLMTAQLGIVGLGLMLYLFLQQWRTAVWLPSLFEQEMARGMLLTIMAGSLFNSLLLDHAEAMFFAWMSGVLFAGYRVARRREQKAVNGDL